MKTSLVIDYDRALVKIGKEQLTLPPKEMDILYHLHKADGRVVTREKLLLDIWKIKPGVIEIRTIDQHLARLRKHLGPKLAGLIVTVPTRGYRYGGPR